MTNEEKAKEICGACDGCTFSCGDRLNCKVEIKYKIALEMAEWKDQQFAKYGYTKQQLLDRGFGFSLNDDIVTPKEEIEMSKKYIKYLRQRWIDKAVEWLKSHGGFTIGFDGATVRDFLNFINK